MNKNIVRIVNNLDKKPLKVRYITGPGVIERLRNKRLSQDIYLFGEYEHRKIDNCIESSAINIEKYFEEVFDKTTKFIDIYIEFQIALDNFEDKRCDVMGEDNSLCDIYKYFRRCITSDSSSCKYPIRLHPIDVRNVRTKGKNSIYRMLNYLWSIEDMKSLKKFIEIYSILIHNIKKISNVSKKAIIESIFETKIIKKEIERSSLSIVEVNRALNAPKLWEDLRKLSEVMTLYPYVRYAIDNSFPYSEVEGRVEGIKNYIRSIFAIHMDVYALARMFKRFNIKSDNHPVEARNIIYYAGSRHTVNMRYMLEELGFSVVERTKRKKDFPLSCVDMKGIKQPIFN